MSQKLLFLISFVLLLSLVTSASAHDTVVWDNDLGAGNRLWDTAVNWDKVAGSGPGADKVPIEDDWVLIGASGYTQYVDDGNGPIIQDGINAVCAWLDMGSDPENRSGFGQLPADGNAVLTMTGGTLTVGFDGEMIDLGADGNAVFNMSGGVFTTGGWTLGSEGAGTATFNMDGGTVNIIGTMWMAWWGNLTGQTLYGILNMSDGQINLGGSLLLAELDQTDATINMTGGIIDVNSWLLIGGWTVGRPGNGHINLHGGTITCGLLAMGGGGVGTMDFANDGTMIVDGDYRGPGGGWLYDPCSDTPACDWEVDCPDEWYAYTGTIAKLAKLGLVTAYNTQVGDIITDGNYPSKAGLRAVINLDYDVTNPGQTTITAGAVDPNLAWNPDPLFGSGGLIPSDITQISWAAGENAASHDIYLGTSFAEVTDADKSSAVYKANQSLADVNYPISPLWGKTYYWRIDEVNGATTWKGTVWNFATAPAWASNPTPEDGAVDAPPLSTVLSWDPGPEVVTHNLYFGTDFNDVNDRLITPVTPGANSYSPGALELDTTYYWAVDEVNNLADVNVWSGQVWSFTTDDHLVVDSFDSYTNEADLWNVWDDYWTNGTGAEIFVEKDPNFIWEGNSIEYFYDNTSIEYTGSRIDADIVDLQSGSDWTHGGVKAMWMVFYGQQGNSATPQDKMWVELEDTSSNTGVVIYDGDLNDVKEEYWHDWHIDLAIFDACGVSLTNIDKVHIGFGGPQGGQGEVPGGTGTVYFDSLELWPPYCRTELVISDFTGDCVTDGFDLNILAADWLVSDYNFIAAEPCEANLIGWWKFDEGMGTITVDSSTYSNDGNVIEATWTTGYPNDPFDSGLDFDGDGVGTSDRVVVAELEGNSPGTYPAELMPDTFTVACWIKLDSFSYFSAFVTNGQDTGADECGFYLFNYGWEDQSGRDFALAIRTETGMNYVETPSIYDTGTWYHLAATYDDANTATVYVDGLLAAGPDDVGGPIRWISSATDSYPNNFVIGVLPWGPNPADWFWTDASIDEVRYYNYALPQSEISVLAGLVTPGTDVYQPVPSVANVTDPEPQFSRRVNFADYSIVADNWLVEDLWP